jgi:hypothetical protein
VVETEDLIGVGDELGLDRLVCTVCQGGGPSRREVVLGDAHGPRRIAIPDGRK